MPSLADSLATLAEQSTAIHTLSEHNLAPPGRFTTAYLDSIRSNPDPARRNAHARRRRDGSVVGDVGGGVLSLIRDAHESEVRLFKFVGESESAGMGKVQRVEKREGIVPLEENGRVRGDWGGGGGGGGEGREEGRDDVETLLNTALKLVDD